MRLGRASILVESNYRPLQKGEGALPPDLEVPRQQLCLENQPSQGEIQEEPGEPAERDSGGRMQGQCLRPHTVVPGANQMALTLTMNEALDLPVFIFSSVECESSSCHDRQNFLTQGLADGHCLNLTAPPPQPPKVALTVSVLFPFRC